MIIHNEELLYANDSYCRHKNEGVGCNLLSVSIWGFLWIYENELLFLASAVAFDPAFLVMQKTQGIALQLRIITT